MDQKNTLYCPAFQMHIPLDSTEAKEFSTIDVPPHILQQIDCQTLTFQQPGNQPTSKPPLESDSFARLINNAAKQAGVQLGLQGGLKGDGGLDSLKDDVA